MGAATPWSSQIPSHPPSAGADLVCTNEDGLDVSALVDAVGTKEMRSLIDMAADQGSNAMLDDSRLTSRSIATCADRTVALEDRGSTGPRSPLSCSVASNPVAPEPASVSS